jgi:hypothetical protein
VRVLLGDAVDVVGHGPGDIARGLRENRSRSGMPTS